MSTVYLAGGMKSNWRDVVKSIKHHEYLDPTLNGQTAPELWSAWDLEAIRQCDVVFFYLEPDDPKSPWASEGGIAELAYGAGLGKHTIFANRRTGNPVHRRLALVRHLSDVVFEGPDCFVDACRYLSLLF